MSDALRTKTLLRDLWALYRASSVPVNASQAQLVHTRKAFYAGASVAVAAIIDAKARGCDDFEQLIANLDDELRRYNDADAFTEGRNE